jgi:RHS repeat-associated protein
MPGNKSALSGELLSAPNGGGAVTGLGEAFQPNLNLGTGTYMVPIELPKGFRQRTPSLSLAYNTAGPQGILGLGWGLPIRGIRRSTSGRAPTYTDDDVLLLDGAALAHMGGNRYRPRIDDTRTRIRRLAEGWQLTEKDGTRYLLGISANSREPGAEGDAQPLAWFVEEERDTTDNVVRYRYRHDRGAVYLGSIEYAIYRVEIHYEERPDVFVDRSAGFRQETRLRCTRIELHRTDVEPSRLREYRIEYVQSRLSNHSLLASVALTGFTYEDGVQQQTAPALRFEYTEFQPENRELRTFEAQADLPPMPGTVATEVVDLDGNGLPGVIQATATSHRYWSNRGGAWQASQPVRSFPRGTSLDRAGVRFADMNGDAKADLLVADTRSALYFPGSGAVAWSAPIFSRQVPQFDATDPSVRLLDADGNSVVDAVRSSRRHLTVFQHDRIRGWTGTPRAIPRRGDDARFPDVDFRDPRVRIADLTGDGRSDWVRLYERAIEYWPSLGELRWDERQLMSVPGPYPDRYRPQRCFFADLDGDGRADLLYLDGQRVFVWMNRGADSFAAPIVIENLPVADPDTVRLGDFLGHGTTGLLFSLRQSLRRGRAMRYVELNRGTKPYLLSRIDNGVGGLTQIEYGYSTDHFVRDRDDGAPWATSLPFPVPVINRYIKTDVTTGTTLETEIRYHDGHFDPERRKFVGFGRVEAIDRSGDESNTRVTVRSYLRGTREESPALAGRPVSTEVFGRDGGPLQDLPFQRESLEWSVVTPENAADGTPILVAEMRLRRIEQLEREANGRVQEFEFEYDEWGNLTREIRRGSGGATAAAGLFLQTDMRYAINAAAGPVNLAAERSVTGAGGELVALERFHYDGADSNGLPLEETTLGLLRRHTRLAFTDAMREQHYPDTNEARLTELGYRHEAGGYWIDERRVDYDARGSMLRTLDPLGHAAQFEYDATGLFPLRVTNALGHVRVATYHPWLGTIQRLTHWDGTQDVYFYTPLGHVEREVRAGDTEDLPTVRFEYRFAQLPISTVMERRVRSGQESVQRSVVYYDGLGEELQRRARAENGQFVVDGFKVRNPRGEVIRQEPPFFSPGEAFDRAESSAEESPHLLQYDALSRVIGMTRDGGHSTRVVYRADGASFYDPDDSDPASPHFDTPTTEQVDAWEQIVAVIETGEAGTIRTEFGRNVFGQVEHIVDPTGVQRVAYTYDLLQRKVHVEHADAGPRTYLFNARGQMAEYVDARDQRVEWDFDALARIVEIRDQGVVKERYQYDAGAGDHLTHRLARVTDEAGATEYSYDARGRVALARRSFEGSADVHDLRMTYDPDGRITNFVYPDGHEVSYDYNTRGLVERMSGMFDGVDYDVRGRRTEVRYEIGVTERFTYFADLGTPETHRVQRNGDGVLLYGRRYEYNKTLHVTAAEDLRAASPQYTRVSRTFSYDPQYRLRRMTGTDGVHDYAYDALDNMTLNGEHGADPFDYNGTRIRGPIIGGATDVRYEHDANGCMVRRLGQQLVYDARQLLRSVEREDGVEVSFAYDHLGRRIRKRVTENQQQRDTLYIGEVFEVLPDGTQRRILSDPRCETRLVATNGNPMLLIADVQGSIVLGVTAGGNEGSRRIYSPYGRIRVSVGATADIGFAGRVLDSETGLYYFRRRYLDPDIGQFITPDVLAVFRGDELIRRTRSLHPYAYGNNSPVSYIDPFGMVSISFWEGLLLVVLVAAAVVATILSAGALAPLLGVAASTAMGIAGGALAAGVIAGAIIGGVQGGWEGALVGGLLGLSVVATVFIGAWVYGGVFGMGVVAGFAIGGVLGGIQAAAFIPQVRQSDVYKGILGWSSWINPWAWPGIAIGAVVFIIDFFATLIDRGELPDYGFEARYGMVTSRDSVADDWVNQYGHNFGTFTWIGPGAHAGTLSHETGHHLNNALFGIFQTSNIAQESHETALWETLAESNSVAPNPVYSFKSLDWWES